MVAQQQTQLGSYINGAANENLRAEQTTLILVAPFVRVLQRHSIHKKPVLCSVTVLAARSFHVITSRLQISLRRNRGNESVSMSRKISVLFEDRASGVSPRLCPSP